MARSRIRSSGSDETCISQPGWTWLCLVAAPTPPITTVALTLVLDPLLLRSTEFPPERWCRDPSADWKHDLETSLMRVVPMSLPACFAYD
jgi:hypothetical protein